jgi:hypothetical protein
MYVRLYESKAMEAFGALSLPVQLFICAVSLGAFVFIEAPVSRIIRALVPFRVRVVCDVLLEYSFWEDVFSTSMFGSKTLRYVAYADCAGDITRRLLPRDQSRGLVVDLLFGEPASQ